MVCRTNPTVGRLTAIRHSLPWPVDFSVQMLRVTVACQLTVVEGDEYDAKSVRKLTTFVTCVYSEYKC